MCSLRARGACRPPREGGRQCSTHAHAHASHPRVHMYTHTHTHSHTHTRMHTHARRAPRARAAPPRHDSRRARAPQHLHVQPRIQLNERAHDHTDALARHVVAPLAAATDVEDERHAPVRARGHARRRPRERAAQGRHHRRHVRVAHGVAGQRAVRGPPDDEMRLARRVAGARDVAAQRPARGGRSRHVRLCGGHRGAAFPRETMVARQSRQPPKRRGGGQGGGAERGGCGRRVLWGPGAALFDSRRRGRRRCAHRRMTPRE